MNITKGKYIAEDDIVYIENDRDFVAQFYEGSAEELYNTNNHAEFYAFASNLSQRVNLDKIDGAIGDLNKLLLELELGDLITFRKLNGIIRDLIA